MLPAYVFPSVLGWLGHSGMGDLLALGFFLLFLLSERIGLDEGPESYGP